MKFILPFVFSVLFSQNFASGRLNLNDDAIVGVNQKNLKEYITKAANGFKKIMLKGDEELNYPVMEPYLMEPFSWESVDTSGSKKYKLNLFSKQATIIKGLSNYEITDIDTSAKDLSLSFQIEFSSLQTEFPYKLDGYLYKNLMPIYGEGLVKLSAPFQNLQIYVNLGIENGYIIVENVDIYRYSYPAEVRITGLMDLPEKFASYITDDILDLIVKKYANEALSKFARGVVEEAVGGMTTDEFFDLLDHFVKRNNQDDD